MGGWSNQREAVGPKSDLTTFEMKALHTFNVHDKPNNQRLVKIDRLRTSSEAQNLIDMLQSRNPKTGGAKSPALIRSATQEWGLQT